MARQFQPPQIPQGKTKEEALLNPISQTMQTLPSLWAQHKRQRLLEEIELRKVRSQYGTGESAPLGPVAESPEEELKRLGSDAYGKLNPAQYGSYVMGPDGKPQFMALPGGFKPAPGIPSPTPILDAEGNQVGSTVGKPTVLPKPNANEAKAEGESAEAQSIAENAIAELNRIRPLNKQSRGGFLGKVKQRAESAIDSDNPSPEFKNTADVINSLKGMVVSVLKSTFGGQLSDGEREYLNEVYGAVEGMSRAEREIAMDGVERTLRAAQKRAASKASAMGGTPTPSSDGGQSGVPAVGGMFQGGKVLKVTRVD